MRHDPPGKRYRLYGKMKLPRRPQFIVAGCIFVVDLLAVVDFAPDGDRILFADRDVRIRRKIAMYV